jgi:hypothetical protein
MATTAAPYGLKPVKRADGMAYAGATSQYLIDPAGEGTNLFYGQVVHIGADGYIALSTATGADGTTNAFPTANTFFPAAQSTSTGSTTTGNSNSAVDATTVTTTAAFRIVAAVSPISDAFPDLLVKFNPGYSSATNAVGL